LLAITSQLEPAREPNEPWFQEKIIITYISFYWFISSTSQMVDMVAHMNILFDLRLLDALFCIITILKPLINTNIIFTYFLYLARELNKQAQARKRAEPIWFCGSLRYLAEPSSLSHLSRNELQLPPPLTLLQRGKIAGGAGRSGDI
jgi:hypothetical protein